jgi:hypothetical protein
MARGRGRTISKPKARSQRLPAVTEERFGLLGERWHTDPDDEPRWSQLVDKLTGCDITLRELYAEAPAVFETALRFEQVTGEMPT